MDVPSGLIDFVEIMQNQRLRTTFWYEFLNLGFELAPAAGSDFPYFEQPGAVRSFVKMPFNEEGDLPLPIHTADWFQQLRQGHTFVSNLPFIEFEVNGQPIGSKLAISDNQTLTIQAKVSINTDYDKLAELELVHCGKVVRKMKASETGSELVTFQHQLSTKMSGWLALRAKGHSYALAHTGAIYLQDEKGSSICKEQAPVIIDTMLERLTLLENAKLDANKELEYWETGELNKAFDQQKSELIKQIKQAKLFYKKLKSSL